MKKISLKNFNMRGMEQLSRDQLKNVLGGVGTIAQTNASCNCDNGRHCYVDPDCTGSCYNQACRNCCGGS